MQAPGCPLTLPSSLPPPGTLNRFTETQVSGFVQELKRLYRPISFQLGVKANKSVRQAVADSGYASGVEDDDDGDALPAHEHPIERDSARRWLTSFLGRAEMLECFVSDEARANVIDEAASVLEILDGNPAEEERRQEELTNYMRDFSFNVTLPDGSGEEITLKINDGLAGQNSKEADDVGVQTWPASGVLSELLCSDPAQFGLSKEHLGDSPNIIDLGAGTGIISFVLARLLPQLGISQSTVLATDYFTTVMDNLRKNLSLNFSEYGSDRIQAATLDWASPSREAPLDKPADMLVATDCVYSPEHAVWLRDCATQFLKPEGIFWLMVTVRPTGKFHGLGDTVGVAFEAEDRPRSDDGRRLTILNEEYLQKRTFIGRGDEIGYRLFKIGWA